MNSRFFKNYLDQNSHFPYINDTRGILPNKTPKGITMELKIVDSFKDIKRIRISCYNGTCTVSWPTGTDVEINDRKKKIHDSVTRCFEHDSDFHEEDLILKSNVQIDRLDKLQYCDLKWEAQSLSDDEDLA